MYWDYWPRLGLGSPLTSFSYKQRGQLYYCYSRYYFLNYYSHDIVLSVHQTHEYQRVYYVSPDPMSEMENRRRQAFFPRPEILRTQLLVPRGYSE